MVHTETRDGFSLSPASIFFLVPQNGRIPPPTTASFSIQPHISSSKTPPAYTTLTSALMMEVVCSSERSATQPTSAGPTLIISHHKWLKSIITPVIWARRSMFLKQATGSVLTYVQTLLNQLSLDCFHIPTITNKFHESQRHQTVYCNSLGLPRMLVLRRMTSEK